MPGAARAHYPLGESTVPVLLRLIFCLIHFTFLLPSAYLNTSTCAEDLLGPNCENILDAPDGPRAVSADGALQEFDPHGGTLDGNWDEIDLAALEAERRALQQLQRQRWAAGLLERRPPSRSVARSLLSRRGAVAICEGLNWRDLESPMESQWGDSGCGDVSYCRS